jgi:uncharacterized protein YcgL (UPF0745 family)
MFGRTKIWQPCYIFYRNQNKKTVTSWDKNYALAKDFRNFIYVAIMFLETQFALLVSELGKINVKIEKQGHFLKCSLSSQFADRCYEGRQKAMAKVKNTFPSFFPKKKS